MDNILPNALSIKVSNQQKSAMKEEIQNILQKIKIELLNAHNEGRYTIYTEIPVVFNVPNMKNKDAQRHIWSVIIEHLEQKNYRVWINPSVQSCKLKITWLEAKDEKEIEYRNKLISSRTADF